MYKCLPILLAFQILAACLPVNQGIQALFKIGGFFNHFVDHLSCHQENIGIVDFVQLHYSGHEHREAGHAGHENLPFQHHHHGQQQLVPQTPGLLPQHPEIVVFPQADNFSNPLIARPQQWFSSLFSGDIWQPPKAQAPLA